MKSFLFSIMLLCFATVSYGQKYTVRPHAIQNNHYTVLSDSLQQNAIYRSGICLQKSADFQWMTVGLACASSALLAIGFDKSSKPCKVAGLLCAGAAVFCDLAAISYKFKAGKELRIGAGRIEYRFSLGANKKHVIK